MARAGLGISLREVAAEISVTPNTISRVENGSDPKTSTLNALRQFYEDRGITFQNEGVSVGVMATPPAQGDLLDTTQ